MYHSKSRKAGFDRLDLTEDQKTLIEETIRKVMRNLTTEEARVQIHEILCPD